MMKLKSLLSIPNAMEDKAAYIQNQLSTVEVITVGLYDYSCNCFLMMF